MPDISSLARRIDAQFTAVEEKVKGFQAQQVEAHKQRQARMQKLAQVFEQMREVWLPRLEYLMQRFGDRVKVSPRVVPATREVTFDFQSHLAAVRLKFSAFTDRDVEKVILAYDLSIVPTLMQFPAHAEIAFPLDAVDNEAVARWVEDRIVDFVQTYFALGENDIYLKDQMVEDPVAHVRFPKMAAAATLDWNGQKFYFVGEETKQEFESQQMAAAK